jgi:hypothetical protein
VHELHTGDTGADHHEVLGQAGRGVGVAGDEDALVIDLGPVRHAGSASGGDEDPVRLELLRGAIGRLHDHPVRSLQATRPPDELHALALQQLGGGRLQA